MLHDVLYMLIGNFGDALFHKANGHYKLRDDIEGLFPGEENQINSLCIFGELYSQVKSYTSTQTDSVYKKALIDGLSHLLQTYNKQVIRLEKLAVNNELITFNYLLCQMRPFECLLRLSLNLIDEFDNKVSGCRFIEYLNNFYNTTTPNYRDYISKIMSCIYSTFIRQLGSWLFHGVVPNNFIIDDNHELCLPAIASSFLPIIAESILYIGTTVAKFKKKNSYNEIFCQFKDKYCQRLFDLRQSHYDVITLEELLAEMAASISEIEWNLLNNSCDITNQFEIIKNYYLFGFNELFINFLHSANHILASPPQHSTKYDLNTIFWLSGNCLNLDENIIEQFSFKIDRDEQNCWSSLCLDYSWPEPFLEVINENDVKKLDAIFKFLLNLSHAKSRLDCAWLDVKRRYKLFSAKWSFVISHMIFFFSFFQYYVQCDVIEEEFDKFMTPLRDGSCKDLRTLIGLKDSFLSCLLRDIYFFSKITHKKLYEIFQLCIDLSDLVGRIIDDGEEGGYEKMIRINRLFEEDVCFIYTAFERLWSDSSNIARRIHLQTNLNYNNFYSDLIRRISVDKNL